MMNWYGSGGWFWMSVWMVVFWAVVIGVVVWVVRQFSRTSIGSVQGSSAITILEERFARGEIDKVELEQRKAVLRDGK
ncbi:MAG TPA: SHOCT domain-containing protein [Candidatus Dormibacteraeota bacterium]|jgi:putative membrane protein